MARETELAKEYAQIIRTVISQQLSLGSLSSSVSKTKIAAVLSEINTAVNRATIDPSTKRKILAETGRELNLEKPETFSDLIVGSINQAQIKESSRMSEFIKRMKSLMNPR